MQKISDLFHRPIDRPIEKVIDYYASSDERIEREISEYEVTPNVARCFKKFLEPFEAGVRANDVTEVGIWVFGYYGSGKSSFTKYLGLALDSKRTVKGRPFRELLAQRLNSPELEATLNTLSTRHKPAVVMLDLAAEQLADLADAPVSTVLYHKVLQTLGYSQEKKLAHLELELEARNQYGAFKDAYREKFNQDWVEVHNQAMIGLGRAAELVPRFFPQEYPTPNAFRHARWEESTDTREQARQMLELIRRHNPGCDAILFLVDEAGQYVAPKGSLILNLDGLIRNFKELGMGKVWMMATGQQTLQEIVEKAALNSAELNKLRDRFPIAIELEATDIKEITRRRLLGKSDSGTRDLKDQFLRWGQAAVNHTRLTDTKLFKGDPTAETFQLLYPFLPQHFDLLLELVRVLARTTGGVGLRSAIRVIQDLLIDTSRTLPAGKIPVAERPVGDLAAIDDFYDTLRQDIRRVLPHVVVAVERIDQLFSSDSDADQLIRRVARAIGALQPLENFPRHEQNLAALLYPRLGAPSLVERVQAALQSLVAHKECGVFNDPQSGGYLFLSDEIRPLRDKRNALEVGSQDISSLRDVLLRTLFEPAPSILLENVKKVQAGIHYGKNPVIVGEDIVFRIEPVEADRFETRRTALLTETNSLAELKNAVVWLITANPEIDELLKEAYRSQVILQEKFDESQKALAQFRRSEERLKAQYLARAERELNKTLSNGVLIFRGLPRAVGEAGPDLHKAAETVLAKAATEIFPYLRLGAKRIGTEGAANFLRVERLDRISSELDPLGLVGKKGGRAVVDKHHPTLSEALRAFQVKVEESGAGRLQGAQVQDLFSSAPYGWTKDTARYVFAGLLVAGEIQLHSPDGVLKTAGPKAAEALKSTLSFNRIGVSLRDGRPSLEALDRAATRLEQMFAIEVLPLEDHISRAVRIHVPREIEAIGSIPDRLRLLGLPGADRARRLREVYTDLLKEDAGGATAHLGARDSFIPDDREWARAIEESLRNEGEQKIQRATALRRGLDELDQLFPGTSAALCPSADATLLKDILASERFFERMGDLRAAVERVHGRIRVLYTQRRTAWQQTLAALVPELESLPGWTRLTEEDRAFIASRIQQANLPEVTREHAELQDLQRLLVRETSLPRLREVLKGEVVGRVPKEVSQPQAEAQPFPAAEARPLPQPGMPYHLPAAERGEGTVLSSEVLTTPEEVRQWLQLLQPQLEAIVESSPVHLVLTRK